MQLSPNDGFNKVWETNALHTPGSVFGVTDPGQVSLGSSRSLTVTVKEQGVRVIFPEASVSVHETVMVPYSKDK